jgi:hypothetical protein
LRYNAGRGGLLRRVGDEAVDAGGSGVSGTQRRRGGRCF